VVALPSLPRVWWSTDLPGYREHLTPFATYSPFVFADLPRIERALDDDLNWLRAAPTVSGSLGSADPSGPKPERGATAVELGDLLRDRRLELPRAFRTFVSDPEPRLRVRSSTLCYLDLGQFPVDVPGGGSLIHFLSDQQWVLHWLLYVGADRSEAVVVTESAFGFEVDGASFDRWEPADGGMSVCAESFSEFLYRFWIENEIWFKCAGSRAAEPLTEEERRYAEAFR